MKSHAVIAGAGIGGLTAAAALVRRGWRVTVCEQAPQLAPARADNRARLCGAVTIGVRL